MAQPAGAVEPLGPATLTDILDGGYRLLRAQPGTVLGLTAVFLVPAAVLAGLGAAASSSPFEVLTAPGTWGSTGGDPGAAAVLVSFAGLLVRSLGIMYLGVALTEVVVAAHAGQRLGLGPAARAALRRSGAVLGSWPLLALGSVAAYVACVLPLAVWLTFTAVVAPVIAAERAGPLAAIGRSFSLVARRFWVALGVVLLSSLVAQVLQTLLSLVPTLVAALLPWGAAWAVTSLGNALASVVTVGPLVLSSVLLYLDLRVRTEGLDLRQRAAAAFTRGG